MAEIPRPLVFNFDASEPFPFARVSFHEVGIDHDGTDADLRTDDLCCFKGTNKGGGDDDVDRADALRGMECLLTTEVGQRRVGLSLPTADGVPFRLAVAYKKETSHGVTVPDPRD